MLPRRLARHAARGALISGALINSIDVQPAGEDPHIVKLLYLAHCTREKGLFDALGAVALANRNCTQSESPLRFHLTVAGEFLISIEREEFETRLQQPDLQLPESHRLRAKTGDSGSSAIRYIGFVGGAEKVRAFTESDCFCFPSYYHAESFGLVLVEAMAFGLPIVATRWRSLPELFPPGYPGLVDIQSPEHLASAFDGVLADKTGVELRAFRSIN